VMYRGAPQDLTWQLQHELCSDAGRATPGSSKLTDTSKATAAPPWETPTTFQDKHCAFSASDNHVVARHCQWSDQAFTHISGSLGGGVGYMCADLDCRRRVRVEGIRETSEATEAEPASLRDGDAVFCSTCQLTEDSCCGVNCGSHGQCSDGVCSCKEGSDLGYGVWFGSGVCGGFCVETDENASYVEAAVVDIFLICVIGVLFCALGACVGAGVGRTIAMACCGRDGDSVDEWTLKAVPCGCVCGFMLPILHYGCTASTPCGTPDSAPCDVGSPAG
jgi:hypothetical protein